MELDSRAREVKSRAGYTSVELVRRTGSGGRAGGRWEGGAGGYAEKVAILDWVMLLTGHVLSG